ncbi:MAG: YhdT family protein [Fusobacteriaceae bacterium]
MKKRDKQIKKEAKITVLLYCFYFLWWYFFAYYKSDNPTEYSYILGFPSWFFYSCILGFLVINILVYLAVKFFFKDMDLD